MKFPAFVGPAYTSQSLNADCERLMNWYPELMESPGAKTEAVLYPCPGFTLFSTIGVGPIRALYSINGSTFVVSGYEFYELDNFGVATLRGTVALDTNPATISSNGDGGGQLFITSGDNGYCYDLTTHTLTNPLTSGATMGAFLDGYFLALDATTSTLRISDLLDGTTWDPTQFAQRTAGADNWVSMAVVHREIWLMGEQTSEVWYNAGTYPFPFAPIPGAFLQQGCAAPFALSSLNNVLLWLSRNEQGAGMVQRADGYQPVRLSTHAIEYAIQGYETISDAVSWTYQDQGHAFYVLVFPTANATWVFDAATQLWHERGYWNSTGCTFEALRVTSHCSTTQNTHLVGDRFTGAVYTQSINVATDVDGLGMRRQRRVRGLSSDEDWILYSQLQLDMETGTALQNGQGSNPQAMLRISRDSGHTWGNEYWTSAGAVGQYAKRVIWNRLGRARNAAFEVTVSDPIPWRLMGAFLTVRKGLS